ncbi:MAG: hypothetical protein AMXMBFR74_11960 [Parvibaculum sp.]|jgi:hypothetical protein|uniref:hypothetical protein n=1 Tax=Parvibaculum sp. TaxID=2024848 RepID=UPI0035BA43A0
MLKSVSTAFAFAVALAFAVIAFNPSLAAAQDLAGAQADIEALLVQYADDPDGLEAAIEEYVTNSEDPEIAAQAIVAVAAGLPANSDLKIALGRGLGAAIAVIALTNPTAATNMQALVAASGDETLVAAVSAGTSDKTASIEQNAGGGDEGAGDEDETPEEPASAT